MLSPGWPPRTPSVCVCLIVAAVADRLHVCFALFRRNALYMYNAMQKLKGMWIKLGQYLSSRNDLLPDE